MLRRFGPALCLLLLLASTFLVYQQGLTGSFIFDDGQAIANNEYLKIQDMSKESLQQAAFSNDSGPLKRPISMLSFALNYYATGMDPFYFKLTNVFIHLANGIGIFILTVLIFTFYRTRFQPTLSPTQPYWLALTVAGAWLLHPFNVSGVLYVVQRMTSLSAFFCIWGLALFVWGRIRLYEGRSGFAAMLTSVVVFAPLALYSKENGALLPVLMLVTEIAFFRFGTANQATRRFLIGFYFATVALPLAGILIYLVVNPSFLLRGYNIRDFTLMERLLTECRVIWFYLRQIALPSVAQMGLYHDGIEISRGLLQPITTLFSVAGILALLTASIALWKKAPLVTFGILFFFVGHALESTVFPFELVFEHRNYLPMYGLLVVVFYYLLYPLNYLANLRIRQITALLLIGLFAAGTFSRANTWSNAVDFSINEVERHPESARAHSEMGDTYSKFMTNDPLSQDHYYRLAVHHYEKATELNKNSVHGLFGLITLSAIQNKPIAPRWLEELTRRLGEQKRNDYGNKLVNLIACQAEGKCNIPHESLKKIVQAPLNNPFLHGANLANAYTAWNLYLGNIKKDDPEALHALFRAVEVAPADIHFRLNLVNYLMIKQRFSEAKVELEKLQKMESAKIKMAEINSLNNVIASHIK